MSATQFTPSAAAAATTASDFESLLNREFRPKSDDARNSVTVAVKALAEMQRVFGDRFSDSSVVIDFGVIAHPAQKPVRNSRSAARTTGDFLAPFSSISTFKIFAEREIIVCKSSML